jgi:hypothetical protein
MRSDGYVLKTSKVWGGGGTDVQFVYVLTIAWTLLNAGPE